jgi:hypothetical protein
MLHSYEAGGPHVILLLFAIYFSSSKFEHKRTYCWSAWLEQYSVPMQALHWGLWMSWLCSALLGCLKCLLTHVECQGGLLNISSFLGMTGSIGQANPAAAKAGDIGLLVIMQPTVSLVSFRSILLHYFLYAAHSSLEPCF